MQLSHASVSI
jgi:hypothetical protein